MRAAVLADVPARDQAMSPIELLKQHLPGACRFYREYGRLTFSQLSRLLAGPVPHRDPSPVLRSSLGRRAAAAGAWFETARRVAEAASAQTASHHGFDCHPETVQGSLIFGLDSLRAGSSSPVLVLASGNVPLGNSLGVGGLVFGRREAGNRRPRLNLFPRSSDDLAAAAAPPLTWSNLETAWGRLADLSLNPLEMKAARRAFEEFFFSEDFPAGPDFLSQAAWFNQRLWAARCAGGPELVFLELEAVARDCLKADLAEPDSPVYRLLFDPRIRGKILTRLAGAPACWSAGRLGTSVSRGERGTVFFWRLNRRGRARALNLSASGRLTGPETNLPLEPEAIGADLESGRLRPGLFLTFLTLAAHGLRVHGGVYMIDYHPPLLAEAESLLETPLGASAPALLGAGPLPLGPAGALELLASSPLPPDFWSALAESRLAESWPLTARQWFLEEKLGSESVWPPSEQPEAPAWAGGRS